MPNFTTSQLEFFNASEGAGSDVSKTEFKDSQVTLDRFEKDVLLSSISEEDIPRGSVKATNARKFAFRVFRNPNKTELHLNFPKEEKNELRLYLSAQAGFKPDAGDYWFIYKDKSSEEIVVGYMDQDRWSLSKGEDLKDSKILISSPPVVDSDDEQFQQEIYDPSPKSSVSVSYRRPRDHNLARKALANAKYACELDPSHETFTSTKGTNYVEAHHIIPISATDDIGQNLDFIENIVSLCPNCHRAVHHAVLFERKKLLVRMYEMRESAIKKRGLNVSIAEIATFYGI